MLPKALALLLPLAVSVYANAEMGANLYGPNPRGGWSEFYVEPDTSVKLPSFKWGDQTDFWFEGLQTWTEKKCVVMWSKRSDGAIFDRGYRNVDPASQKWLRAHLWEFHNINGDGRLEGKWYSKRYKYARVMLIRDYEKMLGY